jgi:hypothetical protein
MNLLSREMLTEGQWLTIRNAPQLVVLAVSASGGSRLDALIEGAAGQRAIANGKNNEHPLVRAIADPVEMEAAMVAVDEATLDARGSLRPPAELARIATEAVRGAVDVLRSLGGDLDLYAYREFIMGIARLVAEAAREDDFLGLGGHRVSDAERGVIDSVSAVLS